LAELDDFAARVRAARDRLRGVPVSDSHELGPADPKTGDRWDRFNVLGHTAEILPFWSRGVRAALDNGAKIGREPGSSTRIEGVESGRLIGEPGLRERIETGSESVLSLLTGLKPEDLEREIETYGQEKVTVRHALETFLVGHFEAHVAQLAELPRA
jgi:hypothetical protein